MSNRSAPDFFCYWLSATGHGGPEISPETLSRIASLDAALGVDFYGPFSELYRPRVTVDRETGYSYIHLGEAGVDGVKTSVPLGPHDDGDPEALDSLVLDFDREGRLVGIEITGPTDAVLRAELLDDGDASVKST